MGESLASWRQDIIYGTYTHACTHARTHAHVRTAAYMYVHAHEDVCIGSDMIQVLICVAARPMDHAWPYGLYSGRKAHAMA